MYADSIYLNIFIGLFILGAGLLIYGIYARRIGNPFGDLARRKNTVSIGKKLMPFIGIILFIYILCEMDFNQLKAAIVSIPISIIILSLSLTFPRILIRGKEWQLIQREQGINIPLLTSTKIFVIGLFYGIITPGYMGQLMRIPLMKEETDEPMGKLFTNVLIELIVHNISLYMMIVIGAIILLDTLPELAYSAVLFILIVLAVVLYFTDQRRGEKTFKTVIRWMIPKRLKPYMIRFSSTFYHDFPRIPRLLPAFVLGTLTWIIIFSQEYMIAHSLDANIPYLSFLLLFPIANAAGFLPITTGGLGTREAVSIFIFTNLFGSTAEVVLIFTLLGFIVTDVFTGFIGFLCALYDSHNKGKSLEIELQQLDELLDN